MTQAKPPRVLDDRARKHIKALAEEMKHQAAGVSGPAQSFVHGMLTGLAAGTEIVDGGTAEGAAETIAQRLAAAIGEAYLDGKLPPQPPAPADDDDRLLSSGEVEAIQARMAMDLHQALGWPLAERAAHQGRSSWGEWWAELCSGARQLAPLVDTVARVRQLCEMTIEQSSRPHAREQARDTLAILDRTAAASTAAVLTGVGAPVTAGMTGGIPKARLLACGLCFEEQGEEVHPHPECPMGATEASASALREVIARTLYETLDRAARNPWDGLSPFLRAVHYQRADAVVAVILPSSRITATLARTAEADVQRVIDLYDRWVKAGPPPLGASMARWWDARLAELREAIYSPENPT
ncbi:hypothetical protein AB0F46_29450 [Streptomyces sp. NPDC026665]|uniref:hypothetical protein n=1 Tax=Streptomyces sp. NPDC026665 TaxID=3154798 RepID=UPI0033F6DAF6